MSSNAETVRSYNEHIREYVDGTPQEVSGSVKEWIDDALALVPQSGEVIELGCGFGRDAAYMEGKGFKVYPTDATQGFVDLMRSRGRDAKLLNALTDDLGGPYDMIFANAVFLHFTTEEFGEVLNKSRNSLKSGGILAFSVKKGEGQEWSDDKLGSPRFFRYWQPESLQQSIAQAGFELVQLGDMASTHHDQVWLHAIARKP